ncbi:MAG: glycosyltransferase [Thermodesulfobacteriota bacterium]
MKILHLIDSGGLYGAEVMLLNLAGEQLRMGLEPTIASIGEKGIPEKPIEKAARENGLPLQTFRMAPGFNVAGALRILRYARRSGFQIFHSHGYKANIFFGLMPSRLRRVPMVSTLHGWTSTGGFKKIRLYEALDRLSLCFVDAVVCVNAGMLENPRIKNLKQVKRLWVVDNGLPMDPMAQDGRETPGAIPETDAGLFCNRKRFTIGTIGRLSTEKGYDDLIMALARIVQNGVDARLIIIGEGYARRQLENTIRISGLSERVFLTGYRPDARRYMPFFDAYAISSLTEGLPITLLEAMQARIPVVATRVGGIPHVLEGGRNGILVEPGNPSALSEGILRLAHDPDLGKALVRNAYRRVAGSYSSRRMAENYRNIYNQLLR